MRDRERIFVVKKKRRRGGEKPRAIFSKIRSRGLRLVIETHLLHLNLLALLTAGIHCSFYFDAEVIHFVESTISEAHEHNAAYGLLSLFLLVSVPLSVPLSLSLLLFSSPARALEIRN